MDDLVTHCRDALVAWSVMTQDAYHQQMCGGGREKSESCGVTEVFRPLIDQERKMTVVGFGCQSVLHRPQHRQDCCKRKEAVRGFVLMALSEHH